MFQKLFFYKQKEKIKRLKLKVFYFSTLTKLWSNTIHHLIIDSIVLGPYLLFGSNYQSQKCVFKIISELNKKNNLTQRVYLKVNQRPKNLKFLKKTEKKNIIVSLLKLLGRSPFGTLHLTSAFPTHHLDTGNIFLQYTILKLVTQTI